MAIFGVLRLHAGMALAPAPYPNKTMRLVSPHPPGGGTTIRGRTIGQKLTDAMMAATRQTAATIVQATHVTTGWRHLQPSSRLTFTQR